MEVLNKLKSAVSNVLPGNPLSRDYDLVAQVASCGLGLMWKVYAAVKRSTKEEASVFIFEKKSADRFSRSDREALVDLLRAGVQQLTKLRHPKILAVIHPVEESRESLAFATEPVFASLSNVLGIVSNISSVPRDLQEFQLHDVEIRHGLLQLADGLGFLHNDAKLLHGNVNPEAVVVTRHGTWKWAGFEFCLHSTDPHTANPVFPWRQWREDVMPLLQPHLDFLAPEYVLTQRCGTSSDMFSLGLLICTVFAKGTALFKCSGQLSSYKQSIEKLRRMLTDQLGEVPEELHEHIKLLLNLEPSIRPDAAQLSKASYFDDVGCVTLQYLDTLFQRENIEKSNFFKSLPKIIAKLPKRVNLQRIMPALVKESFNADMVPFLLPSMLHVAQQVSLAEYHQHILPALVPLFRLQSPIQVVLIFLQNMSLLLSRTPKGDIQTHVLPMIFRALESNSLHIQELCLGIIPTFAELIEYPTLKNVLIPRIKKLCQTTSTLTVRVNCLLCIGQLLDHTDRWYVMDEILPFLSSIPSREPAVLMSILGIHKVTMEDSKLGITKDALASKILPFLIPISVDSSLNLMQFNAFMAVIRDMLDQVESEHRSKLEQLDHMKKEQRSLEIAPITSPDCVDPVAQYSKPPSMMDKFLSGVGLSELIGSQKPGDMAVKNDVTSLALETSGASLPAAMSASVGPQGAMSLLSPGFITTKKPSLSLQEKQTLARQQEQHELLKSRPALVPTLASEPGNKTSMKKVTDGPRDLTASLMDSNFSAKQLVGSSPTGPSAHSASRSCYMFGAGESAGGGRTPVAAGSWQQSKTSGSSHLPTGSRSLAGKAEGRGTFSSQQSRANMSALDSLLTSPSSPAPSLNQMMAAGGQGSEVTGMRLPGQTHNQGSLPMGQSMWAFHSVGVPQGHFVPTAPMQMRFGQLSETWPAASLTPSAGGQTSVNNLSLAASYSAGGQTSTSNNVPSSTSNNVPSTTSYSALGDLLG